VSALTARTVPTAKGTSVRAWEGGGPGSEIMFLHDMAGLLDDRSFLEQLAAEHRVVAPELPGYGESAGEELLEDMLDFALHAWDVIDATGVTRPVVVGHGLGGMIAAEMTALCPHRVERLVLIAPLGLWLDEAPVPDLFSMLPYEFPRVLFADPDAGAPLLLAGGTDFADLDALKEFYIGNTRRLGTAGKVLFPIPDRRLSKRLYRVTTPTLLIWGELDALVDPVYGDRWRDLLPDARVVLVKRAGHMVPYEQPEACAAAVRSFVGSPVTSP
jgi:pimeloyl-ACP methyl ester carboxylesterase